MLVLSFRLGLGLPKAIFKDSLDKAMDKVWFKIRGKSGIRVKVCFRIRVSVTDRVRVIF